MGEHVLDWIAVAFLVGVEVMLLWIITLALRGKL